jgi:hypothetical protein
MTTRRLAAILAADIVGYSKLVGEDEVGTLARLRHTRRDVTFWPLSALFNFVLLVFCRG